MTYALEDDENRWWDRGSLRDRSRSTGYDAGGSNPSVTERPSVQIRTPALRPADDLATYLEHNESSRLKNATCSDLPTI